MERAASLPPRAAVNSRLSSNSNCQGSMVPFRMSMFSGLQGSKEQGGGSSGCDACAQPRRSRLSGVKLWHVSSCLYGISERYVLPAGRRRARCGCIGQNSNALRTAAVLAAALSLRTACRLCHAGCSAGIPPPTQRTRQDDKLLTHAARAVRHLDFLQY